MNFLYIKLKITIKNTITSILYTTLNTFVESLIIKM